jgi:hypothetical protein
VYSIIIGDSSYTMFVFLHMRVAWATVLYPIVVFSLWIVIFLRHTNAPVLIIKKTIVLLRYDCPSSRTLVCIFHACANPCRGSYFRLLPAKISSFGRLACNRQDRRKEKTACFRISIPGPVGCPSGDQVIIPEQQHQRVVGWDKKTLWWGRRSLW